MRIALSIEYNGSAYFGWQKQKINKTKTIQYHIDKAVSRIANNEISTVCAGRTDTGVHAFSQIVHFDSSCDRENYKWIQGINSFLPSDILVKNIYHVDNDFHARYSAVDRTYRYIILNQTHPSTYFLTTALHYSDKINISKIKSSSCASNTNFGMKSAVHPCRRCGLHNGCGSFTVESSFHSLFTPLYKRGALSGSQT